MSIGKTKNQLRFRSVRRMLVTCHEIITKYSQNFRPQKHHNIIPGALWKLYGTLYYHFR